MRFLAILLLLSCGSVIAAIETYSFENKEQEQTYKRLIEELRCLVCQNQNIADSNADLAKDLRQKTYEMISAGQSRDQVVDFMTERYGDFVLYQPPMKLTTLVLWIAPLLFVLIAVIVVIRLFANRDNTNVAQDKINKKQLKKVRKLLYQETDQS